MPRCEFSHQCWSSSSPEPLLTTVQRIHTNGTKAMAKARPTSVPASRLVADRRPDGLLSAAGTTDWLGAASVLTR
jgi:hypothetical protein